MSESVLTDVLEIELPSGVNVRCYEMTVTDANRLANPKRREQAFNDVMRNRVKVVGKDSVERPFDPNLSPLADVFSAMIGVRRVTHGDNFLFACQCTNCRKKWDETLDLSEERFDPKPIKWCDDGDLTKGVDRETLQFVLELSKPHRDIAKVRCQLLRGGHQTRIAEIDDKSDDRRISELMKMRIVGFEGVINPADKDRPPEKQRLLAPPDEWIDSIPLRLQREFSRRFDEFDGGVESNIDLDCPKCEFRHRDFTIPFKDRDFFSPR